MNLKNSQYQAIMRQYDLRQLQHRHLQSQRYQEICAHLPAYRQLESAGTAGAENASADTGRVSC